MSGEASRHAREITRAVIPQLNHPAQVTGVSGYLSSVVAAERGRLCGGTQRRLEELEGSGFSPACPSGTGHSVRSLAGDRDVPRGLRGVRETQNCQRRRGAREHGAETIAYLSERQKKFFLMCKKKKRKGKESKSPCGYLAAPIHASVLLSRSAAGK